MVAGDEGLKLFELIKLIKSGLYKLEGKYRYRG